MEKYCYTKKRIDSTIWYDRAMKRAMKNKTFTKEEFYNRFISIYLHVEDNARLNTAYLKAAYVFSTFKNKGNIVVI